MIEGKSYKTKQLGDEKATDTELADCEVREYFFPKGEINKPVEFVSKFNGAIAGVSSSKTPSYITELADCEVREYFFPSEGITVMARDTQEATEKMLEIKNNKNN